MHLLSGQDNALPAPDCVQKPGVLKVHLMAGQHREALGCITLLETLALSK